MTDTNDLVERSPDQNKPNERLRKLVIINRAKLRIINLEAELDAANNKLAKALEIAELFSGGVEYDYSGNIVGEEERKAMAELEELAGGKDD